VRHLSSWLPVQQPRGAARGVRTGLLRLDRLNLLHSLSIRLFLRQSRRSAVPLPCGHVQCLRCHGLHALSCRLRMRRRGDLCGRLRRRLLFAGRRCGVHVMPRRHRLCWRRPPARTLVSPSASACRPCVYRAPSRRPAAPVCEPPRVVRTLRAVQRAVRLRLMRASAMRSARSVRHPRHIATSSRHIPSPASSFPRASPRVSRVQPLWLLLRRRQRGVHDLPGGLRL
jgi:hypothetical protein